MAADAGIWWQVLVPVGTFVLGFLVSRFTLSKKERFDVASQKQARSQELTKARDEAFTGFTAAITRYANSSSAPDLDEFTAVATTGEKYFTVVQMICDAVLNSQLPESTVSNTHLQTVRDVVDRTLPKFFSTLQDIAAATQLRYSGELRRSDYESIYAVYEKYELGL